MGATNCLLLEMINRISAHRGLIKFRFQATPTKKLKRFTGL